MTVVTFTVKDSVTGAPIAGAYAYLVCTFAGGGTIPYNGYSDSNGVVSIDIDGNVPVIGWSVSKSGYQTATGSGTPPSIVNLVPTVPPPPSYGGSTATKTITVSAQVIGTNLTINAPDTVAAGARFTVSGRLTRSDTGAGIAGQPIYLYFDSSSLSPSSPVITGSDGSYSASDAVINSAGTYTLKAQFMGTSSTAAAEATRSIGVTGVKTYIVYDSDLSDKRSAELIAEKKGFILLQTPETKDPSVYDPLYDDNNIVCVGGGLLGANGKPVANAYSYYYFPMKLDSEGKLHGQFGISADGRRIIATKRRANGTTVTIVSGIDEPDTWRAANEYCKEPVSPLVPVGILAAVAGGACYVSMRRKM
jgi:hypothetical protein